MSAVLAQKFDDLCGAGHVGVEQRRLAVFILGVNLIRPDFFKKTVAQQNRTHIEARGDEHLDGGEVGVERGRVERALAVLRDGDVEPVVNEHLQQRAAGGRGRRARSMQQPRETQIKTKNLAPLQCRSRSTHTHN